VALGRRSEGRDGVAELGLGFLVMDLDRAVVGGGML
jgi:hypothetical protein